MSILIGGQSFHHVYANDSGIWVRGSNKDLRHGGDQVLVGTATDLVDLVGGIVEHLVQLAQFFAGGIVQNGTALQLGIEVLALGQLGVGAADGDRFALQRRASSIVATPGKASRTVDLWTRAEMTFTG